MNKNKISRKLLVVLMALCVIFAYTGFAFAGTEGEDTTTPETGTEVTETVVEDEPVEGTEEPVVEETTEDTEEPVVEETPAPKAKKASKKAKSSLSLLADEPEGGESDDFYLNGGHAVSVKGETKYLFCLQHDFSWPDDKARYHEVGPEALGLTSEQAAEIMKVIFAGYPCDAAGIFEGYEAWGEIFKSMVTENAVWVIMKDYNIPGNTDANKPADEKIPSLEELYAMDDSNPANTLVRDLVEFAKSDAKYEKPESNEITISGMGEVTETDGVWISDELKINNPTGYNLTYTLSATEGLTIVAADKTTPITEVKGDTAFYVISESGEIAKSAAVSASATAKYPTRINFYATSDRKENGVTGGGASQDNDYQTMAGITIDSISLNGSLNITVKKEEPTTPPVVNPPVVYPPVVGPTDPSTPEEPTTPDNPSDDEMDSDALGNGGADTIDDEDDSIDGDPMGDPDAIDDEEDVDADALGVKTGDASDMIPWTVGFTAALLGLFVALKVRRREN